MALSCETETATGKIERGAGGGLKKNICGAGATKTIRERAQKKSGELSPLYFFPYCVIYELVETGVTHCRSLFTVNLPHSLGNYNTYIVIGFLMVSVISCDLGGAILFLCHFSTPFTVFWSENIIAQLRFSKQLVIVHKIQLIILLTLPIYNS